MRAVRDGAAASFLGFSFLFSPSYRILVVSDKGKAPAERASRFVMSVRGQFYTDRSRKGSRNIHARIPYLLATAAVDCCVLLNAQPEHCYISPRVPRGKGKGIPYNGNNTKHCSSSSSSSSRQGSSDRAHLPIVLVTRQLRWPPQQRYVVPQHS